MLATLQTAMVKGDAANITAIVTAARQVESKLVATRKAIESEKAKAVATTATTKDFESLADRLYKSETKGELRQKIKLAIADTVKAMTIWVQAQGIRRAAVVKVEFHGHQVRHFGVVTERGHQPILALHNNSVYDTAGYKDMLDALLKKQYAIGGFVVTMQETAPGKWQATTPSYANEMKKAGPPQDWPRPANPAWKMVQRRKA